MTITRQLDTKTTIPTGSELRILLNSTHISYGEIHSTLKEKGIYVGDSSKSVTVPLLTSTLITDTEFKNLLDKSIDRESKIKVKLSDLDLCAPDNDWVSPLKPIFNLNDFDPSSDMEYVEFNKSPSLVIKGPDLAVITYSIYRRDISQDLIKRELIFEAEVTIEKSDGTLKLSVTSEHTSNETDIINSRIISHSTKTLKDAGIVSKADASKITFNLFTNKERILFFKRLTSGISQKLALDSVNHIDISLNKEGTALPNDPQIAWMKDADKRVQIDGNKLNNIFLLSDNSYYKYYYILKMEVSYRYVFEANKGNCRIVFQFSNLGKDLVNRNNSELSFEISSLKHTNTVNPSSKKQIRRDLTKNIEKLILEKFAGTVKTK